MTHSTTGNTETGSRLLSEKNREPDSVSLAGRNAAAVVGLCALAVTGALLAVPWIAAEPSEALVAGCVMASQAAAGLSILCGLLVHGRARTLVLVVPPLVYLAVIYGVG